MGGNRLIIHPGDKHSEFLTAVKFVAMKPGKGQLWLYRCRCGVEKNMLARGVLTGHARSCGCYETQRQAARTIKGKYADSTKKRLTPEYKSWEGMIGRCTNVKVKNYGNYGGRGITVCARWRSDFAAFLADVGQRPTVEHSLDRFPNNDGNYEPGNVRWATVTEQARNRRTNILASYCGEPRCVSEITEMSGLSRHTVRELIRRNSPIPEREFVYPG